MKLPLPCLAAALVLGCQQTPAAPAGPTPAPSRADAPTADPAPPLATAAALEVSITYCIP